MHHRLYKPEDFAALYAIEVSCFLPPLRFSRSYMLGLLQQRNAATWVAEEDGALCGFAIVEWTREGASLVAYIQTLEVVAQRRGRGLGGELLLRMEGSALDAGCPMIWLHVDAENDAAIRLYEARGYAGRGREEGYYGRDRAALIYAKTLAVKAEGCP